MSVLVPDMLTADAQSRQRPVGHQKLEYLTSGNSMQAIAGDYRSVHRTVGQTGGFAQDVAFFCSRLRRQGRWCLRGILDVSRRQHVGTIESSRAEAR